MNPENPSTEQNNLETEKVSEKYDGKSVLTKFESLNEGDRIILDDILNRTKGSVIFEEIVNVLEYLEESDRVELATLIEDLKYASDLSSKTVIAENISALLNKQ